MKSFIFLCSLFFFLPSCSENSKGKENPEPDTGIFVPLTKLLTLDDFEPKYIRVFGYIGSVGDHLFLTKDHAEGFDYSSAVSLVLNLNENNYKQAQDCYGKYAEVTGKAQRDSDGNIMLGDVIRIHIPDAGDCYVRK